MSGLTERVARAIAPHLWAENVYVSRNFDEPGTMTELIEKRRDHIRAQARLALGAVADDVDGLAGVLRDHSLMPWNHEGAWTCGCGTVLEPLVFPYRETADRHQAEQLAAHVRDGAA